MLSSAGQQYSVVAVRWGGVLLLSHLREAGRVAGQWCLGREEIPWWFLAVDRLTVIPFSVRCAVVPCWGEDVCVVPALRTWWFLAVDRMTNHFLCEVCGGPLLRRIRVRVVPALRTWWVLAVDQPAVIPFCEVCGGPLLGRRVVCGGHGVPEEEQCWSLFERHFHPIYICINLNKCCPYQQI